MSQSGSKAKKEEIEISGVKPNATSSVATPGIAIVSGTGDLSKEAQSLPDNRSAKSESASSKSRLIDLADDRIDLKYLLKALIKYNASDLHLKPERPPLYRINGKLIPAKMPKFTIDKVNKVIRDVLSERHIKILEERLQLDFSFTMGDFGRFRCNVFFQRGTLAAVIRMIPITIPALEDLALPKVLKELCKRNRGLILITGSTGMGKSTTLASMVQYINENRHAHVLTIEDPIEFIHRDKKASITQREVGSDTHAFHEALYSGLRQDPDVIMLGELRDPQTIQTALTAAETGHLVMSTLHTNGAVQTIERILDVFPPDGRAQVRIQLASSLVAVVSQRLLSRQDGLGRVPACEVMVNSPTIENYILKDEIKKIPSAIESSSSYYKMQSMNDSLQKLLKRNLVTLDEALKASNRPDDLKLKISGLSQQEGYNVSDGATELQQSKSGNLTIDESDMELADELEIQSINR